ncbi:glycosyltransferase family 2 protein [Micromonospora sp. PLK6-60]|uniref:glycosyltransferase n=1 Tax=Micromonospora sp. PLK6-60 TaxID=2873383 RepID=UPI001CA736BC|nr:glycosyltransferase family 2 protein [Micromonospora sp. PLK6-60]MBY8874828.1 glycosyltransferase family 2 protein [Micromonospora sp. PLK6-60]
MATSTSVIVHYGDLTPTIKLVNDIVEYGTEVVVVANDRAPRPAEVDDRVEWIVPDRNLGYGDAFMLAARGRSARALLLLNTDIVLPRDSFERCLDTLFSEPGVGIVGPILRHEDGSLQSGAARFSAWRRAPRVLIDPGPRTVDCDWVTGAVMFIRREVVEDVGLDGSFFIGAEDTDLCVRARRTGWRVLCCGDAPATHHGSRVMSGSRWTYYTIRNRVWFARTNFGVGAALLNWIWAVSLLPRMAVGDILKRRDTTRLRLGLMALRHAWWRKPSAAEGPLPDEPLPARIMSW